jgi:hypothetical protein
VRQASPTVRPCRLHAPSRPCRAYPDGTALLYLTEDAALLPVSTQTQGGALPTYPSILPLFYTEIGHRAIVFHCCRDVATLTVPIAGPRCMFRSSCSPSCVRPSSREFTLQEGYALFPPFQCGRSIPRHRSIDTFRTPAGHSKP